GLTDGDAGGTVGRAKPAAAATAVVARRPVDLAAAIARTTGGHCAGADRRPGFDVTHERTAIRAARAEIAGLDAEGRIQLAATARAELRTTLRVLGARVSGRRAR